MIMFATIVISLALVACCVMIHYELLRQTSELIPHLSIATRSKVLVVIAGVFLAHLIEVLLFAIAYGLMHLSPQFGTIAGQFSGTPLDFFYFSITSYTTLGVGDLFPHGPFRLVAGIQALVGFVLTGWSASFTYLAMEKFWSQHPRRRSAKVTRKDDAPSE